MNDQPPDSVVRQKQKSLRPLLRELAALTLVVFVAAQAACIIHCHFEGGHGTAGKPSCHGTAQAKPSPGKHVPPAPSSSCATLKSLLAGDDAYTLAAPVLQLVHFVLLTWDALKASEQESALAHSRQPLTRDWAFTPEVCLGPAFRSLAPPVASS
jgi:hypothetical protein